MTRPPLWTEYEGAWAEGIEAAFATIDPARLRRLQLQLNPPRPPASRVIYDTSSLDQPCYHCLTMLAEDLGALHRLCQERADVIRRAMEMSNA